MDIKQQPKNNTSSKFWIQETYQKVVQLYKFLREIERDLQLEEITRDLRLEDATEAVQGQIQV
ncbi:hypothetical protein FRX31_023385 [Thalictrum thalictroides]|uniref:Uncharacterized protein n=1 Tax=Thalictrum thalictroides TaxID=46969 RepID=A0A7J6VR16_THATH|nr:hypothetical protein FRX31_023385 [Thalictrum thalictroides]